MFQKTSYVICVDDTDTNLCAQFGLSVYDPQFRVLLVSNWPHRIMIQHQHFWFGISEDVSDLDVTAGKT